MRRLFTSLAVGFGVGLPVLAFFAWGGKWRGYVGYAALVLLFCGVLAGMFYSIVWGDDE